MNETAPHPSDPSDPRPAPQAAPPGALTDAADPHPAPPPAVTLGQVDAAVAAAVTDAQRLAAQEVAAALKGLHGVSQALHSLITGNTVAEVQQAYIHAIALRNEVIAEVKAELGSLVPAAHAAPGAPPPPATAFELIRAGLNK